MTTHDPLTIAGLTRQEVRVMHRVSETHSLAAMIPSQDPRGLGISGILTSDLFGLRSDLDLETLGLLDEQRDLETKHDLTDKDKIRLAELRERLQDVDMSTRFRDPLFREFTRALMSNEDFRETQTDVLTPEQINLRRRLALQALEEAKKREGLKAN